MSAPLPVAWRAAPFQSGKRMQIADAGGHRLCIRQVTTGSNLWRVSIDGRALGCWVGMAAAKEAAEEALMAVSA